MERVILHCDCNSFFASVETVINPSYRNVPMAVCGSVQDRHGIVLAKNELAKRYGIQTAETVYSAKKKCPDLVIAEPHHSEYIKYSKIINEIYKEYTELVEPFGIDESWLDVTASQRIFGSGENIAQIIRKRIRKEVGLTVSVGISFNKVFAKLGSDYKKPDAQTLISKENFKSLVFPLPVEALLFVGKGTKKELNSIGIKTIGDLASFSRQMLVQKFGKMGDMLYLYSNGLDDSPVSAISEEVKSISNGLTFKYDLKDSEDCRVAINYLSEEIGTKLRRKNLKCSTVSITVKDSFLKSVQRQRHITRPTDISSEIADEAFSILTSEWNGNIPIRMITVSVSGFDADNLFLEQIDLFTAAGGEAKEVDREKTRKKEETVDKIRQKYGISSIIRGSVIDSDMGLYKK